VDYLARRYNIDIITFREHPGEERRFPADRIRDTLVLDLEPHSRTTIARALRNTRRFLRARPPLLDRYSGFDKAIRQWLAGRVYNIVVIEHFWCAPYAGVLRDSAERLVLDLHNVESVLQQTTSKSERWPATMMFRRFARAYAALEREWLPKFDDILVTSSTDAGRVTHIAPDVNVVVYPNTLPRIDQPVVDEENAIAFSGNLEYHANQLAIRWFARDIWPTVHAAHPGLEWRLIGKNAHAVRDCPPGVKVIGEVEDAVRELSAARIVVVPLQSGSGTRFKILEAWAACRAVVSTPLGAEGLDAIPGEHLLIAEDAPSFIAAIEALLDDPDLRERLGSAGRRHYLERFTNETGWRALDSGGF
jgi:glycosyltransferase involved in cell wall biosynthesis